MKAKIIRLETERSNIMIMAHDWKGHPLLEQVIEYSDNETYIDNYVLFNTGNANSSSKVRCKFQHLYVTTNNQIKEGDWCYNTFQKTIFKINAESIRSLGGGATINKRIIATTDELIIGTTEVTHPTQDNSSNIYLPQIPTEFTKKYCEQGGIEDVEVEYEHDDTIPYPKLRLKVNSHNTIIVIKELKSSYSREEVIAFGRKCAEFGYESESDNEGVLSDRWISKNL